MKKIAWYAVLVLLTVAGLIVLWQFRRALILFLLSLALASAFHPLINFLTDRRLPRGVALFVSYGIVIGVFVGLLWVVSGPFVRDLEQVSNQLSLSYGQVRASWMADGTTLQRTLAGSIPQSEELFIRSGNEEGLWFVQGMMSFTSNLASFFGGIGMVLILSLYWSADRLHFERLLLSLITVDQRPQVRASWRAIENGVGAYIRSELTQSLLAGLLLWSGYRLMGINNSVLLATLGALFWLIPWFGAVIAMIPPFLVGLLSADLTLGVTAALYTLLILSLQEFIIQPRIFRRTSYNSIVLVLVILILTDAFGLIGLLLAPLVSATIQNIFKYLIRPPIHLSVSDETSDPPEVVTAQLRKRLELTKDGINESEPGHSLNIISMVNRLDQLIDETERYMETHTPDSGIVVASRSKLDP